MLEMAVEHHQTFHHMGATLSIGIETETVPKTVYTSLSYPALLV